jgi:hypothetical protein
VVLKIERFQPEGMNVRMSSGKPSYSHVVTVSGSDKIVYTAGQLARDIDGNCVGNRRGRLWSVFHCEDPPNRGLLRHCGRGSGCNATRWLSEPDSNLRMAESMSASADVAKNVGSGRLRRERVF